jgi:alpha-L-fucosidase
MHIHFWPGDCVVVAGLEAQVKSARFFASGDKINFQQDRYRVRLTGLPLEAPDHPVTTIVLECDAEPSQDNIFVRKEKPREGV